MTNIYAICIATNVCRDDVTTTGLYDDKTEVLYRFDERYTVRHESGARQMKLEDGKLVMRTINEIQSEPEYKSWWNAKIEAQLEKLDIKRIRPNAEINDDDMSAQEKTDAKSQLKTLNAQAAALRAQIIK